MNTFEICKILHDVCENGNLLQLENINLTLEHVQSENNKALRWACIYGHLEVTKWLVDTFELTIHDVRSENNCAFRYACSNGHLEVAKWLVDKFGLTIVDVESDNNHAFRYACSNGHLNIMQFFIERFQLIKDDYTKPVNRHWISLIKKACKERNGFMVSWLVTKFLNNEILLNDILLNEIPECKEFVEEVLNENEVMIKPASKTYVYLK